METLSLKSIKEVIRQWYIPLLVGIFFVIVSIVAFVWPKSSFLTLSILFALSFLFGGLSEIIFSVSNRKQMDTWGWSLAFGIITFIVGVLLVINPKLSMITLAFYIGFVLLFRSIATIGFALDIKKYGNSNLGGLLAFGILGAIFSFILIWNPAFAGLSAVIFIGLSFLFAGLFSIYLALQLRKLNKSSKKISAELRERYDELMKEIREEWDS
ncbi:MAG: DUF308 domain-containing protein [Bacteroidales bacterium]|jgi:uncharacterized membrane protein HdeD (DUF308 family)|nr:DUF308 domain-containing protein [Bacteroidales bacterium]MDD4672193.1 DUF308 domain-containing protein [Bacteroidales bacterium]MDY0348985.1 DUF308 domain-containing protein [Tenuifilaceae bacterium]